MRQGLLTILVVAFVWAALPVSVTAADGTTHFKDVNDKHWAKATIEEGVRTRIVKGYPDGTFRPSNTITRAEVASMLSSVTTLSPSSSTDAFTDLDNHWSKDAVRKLVALGFISTKDYTKGFDPNKAITRYELMKWMATGLSVSEPSFKQALTDVKDTLLPTPESFKGGITKDQVPYIALVRGTSIVNGFPDGSFKPEATATRAEVLTMMLRYAQVEGTKAEEYRDLQEMIGVSLEGTNMLQLTDDVRYVKNSLTVNELSKKTISLPSADLVIHRMIFVDAKTSEYKGVYAKLFTDGQNEWPDEYMVFQEATLTLKSEKFDAKTRLRIQGEINKYGSAFSLNSFRGAVDNKQIVPALPRSNSVETVKKEIPYTFWTPHTFKAQHDSYDTLKINGELFAYGIW